MSIVVPRRERRDRVQRVEDDGAVGGADLPAGRDHVRHRLTGRRACRAAGERRRDILVHLQHQPRTRGRALVHQVVQQPGVPGHRYPPARGAQVRLRGHRVLRGREQVAQVGEDLHQGDAGVRRVPVGPGGGHRGQPVEEHLAQAGVVPAQIVDYRFGDPDRRADRGRRAVQVGVAVHAEAEQGLGQARIEPGGLRLHDHQPVAGQVAKVRRPDHEQRGVRILAGELRDVGGGRGGQPGELRGGCRPGHLDGPVRRLRSGQHLDTVAAQAGGQRAQAAHQQGAVGRNVRVARVHLDVVDAVQQAAGQRVLPAPVGVVTGVRGQRVHAVTPA